MYVNQRVTYTQHILRGAMLNEHKAVLLECKKLAKDLTGDKWIFSELKGVSTEEFWNWYKSDRHAYDGYS